MCKPLLCRQSEQSPGLDKTKNRRGYELNAEAKPPRFKTPEDQRRYELQGEIAKQEAYLDDLRLEEKVLTPRLESLREKEKRLEATLQREFCELTPRLAALEQERNALEDQLQLMAALAQPCRRDPLPRSLGPLLLQLCVVARGLGGLSQTFLL